VKPADRAEPWELLQHEVEVSRRLTIAALQIRAAVTARLNRLALHWSIDVLAVPRPGLTFRVLLRSSRRLHFEPKAVAIRNLDKLTVALAPGECPPSIFGPKHFSRIIVEKDDPQLGWPLPVRLCDVRRWHPHHVLPAKRFPFENEVIQPSRVVISIARLWPLADCNLNRYREFLEGQAVLIMR
jgi:hypothetical protein